MTGMNSKVYRQKPARNAFVIKLEILEEAVLSGLLPSDLPRLKKRSDFQNWDGPQEGAKPWSNTKVMNLNGPNADLRLRLEKVWAEVQRLQGQHKPSLKPRKPLEQSLLEAKIASLNVQVYKLIVERDSLKGDLLRAEQQRHSLSKENQVLLKRLNGIIPFAREQ
jgi:hypothetical protein